MLDLVQCSQGWKVRLSSSEHTSCHCGQIAQYLSAFPRGGAANFSWAGRCQFWSKGFFSWLAPSQSMVMWILLHLVGFQQFSFHGRLGLFLNGGTAHSSGSNLRFLSHWAGLPGQPVDEIQQVLGSRREDDQTWLTNFISTEGDNLGLCWQNADTSE